MVDDTDPVVDDTDPVLSIPTAMWDASPAGKMVRHVDFWAKGVQESPVNAREMVDIEGGHLDLWDRGRSRFIAEHPGWNVEQLLKEDPRSSPWRFVRSTSGTEYPREVLRNIFEGDEETREYWGAAGGPTDFRRRMIKTLDEVEQADAMGQYGTIPGFALIVGSGMIDPVGWAFFRGAKGVFGAPGKLETYNKARRIQKVLKQGKRITAAEAAFMSAFVAQKLPSWRKKLTVAGGLAAVEGFTSLYVESFFDEQLDVEDFIAGAGAAAVFSSALLGIVGVTSKSIETTGRMYQRAVGRNLVDRVDRAIEGTGEPSRSFPRIEDRELLVSAVRELAEQEGMPYELAFEQVMKLASKVGNASTRVTSVGLLRGSASDLQFSNSQQTRALARILFKKNLTLRSDPDTDIPLQFSVGEVFHHNRQVVDSEVKMLIETSDGDSSFLEAVMQVLDEAPVEILDDAGSPTGRMVDRLDAENSPFKGKPDDWKVAVRGAADRIKKRVLVYEGEQLGLAEKLDFYFPHGQRIDEYVLDPARVSEFKTRAKEYLIEREGYDPDDPDLDEIIESLYSKIADPVHNRSDQNVGFTIDNEGNIRNQFVGTSVAVTGSGKERTVRLPLRVMRMFYEDDPAMLVDSGLSRTGLLRGAQELLKLNPKGTNESLPRFSDETPGVVREPPPTTPTTPRPVEGPTFSERKRSSSILLEGEMSAEARANVQKSIDEDIGPTLSGEYEVLADGVVVGRVERISTGKWHTFGPDPDDIEPASDFPFRTKASAIESIKGWDHPPPTTPAAAQPPAAPVPKNYTDDLNDLRVNQAAREKGGIDITANVEQLGTVKQITDAAWDARVSADEAYNIQRDSVRGARSEIRDAKIEVKEEHKAAVRSRQEQINRLLDEQEESESLIDGIADELETHEGNLGSVESQLNKRYRRMEEDLRSAERSLENLIESGKAVPVRRDLADVELQKAEKEVQRLHRKEEKMRGSADISLGKKLESQKVDELGASTMIKLLKHFSGDHPKVEGYSTKQINDDIKFLSDHYLMDTQVIKDFLRKSPEAHIGKYEKKLLKATERRTKTETDLKEFSDSDGKSVRLSEKDQAKLDEAMIEVEKFSEVLQQPTGDETKVWNTKVANSLAVEIKTRRSSLNSRNQGNLLDISDSHLRFLESNGVKIRFGKDWVEPAEARVRIRSMLEDSSKLARDLNEAESISEGAIRKAAREAEKLRAFIKDNGGKDSDVVLQAIARLESAIANRSTAMDSRTQARGNARLARKQYRETIGHKYETGDTSAKEFDAVVADVRESHVMESLSLGIETSGGRYKLTDKGHGGVIRRDFEKLIEANPERRAELEAEMDNTAAHLGRWRDYIMGLERREPTGIQNTIRAASSIGSQWRTLFTIMKNTFLDNGIAIASGVGMRRLANTLARGVLSHLPGGKIDNIDGVALSRVHSAGQYATLNRQGTGGGGSNRAFQLGEEGSQATSRPTAKDNIPDTARKKFGWFWQRASGFRYTQPYLRETYSLVYEDIILNLGEDLHIGKKIHPEDIEMLNRAGLSTDDAYRIFEEWSLSQPVDELTDVSGFRRIGDIDQFSPPTKEKLEQGVFNLVERIHLIPRPEELHRATKELPSYARGAEDILLALNGFNQSAFKNWFMTGTQSILKHKRLGHYAIRGLEAGAIYLGVEELWSQYQKKFTAKGAHPKSWSERPETFDRILTLIGKSGILGPISGAIDSYQYSVLADDRPLDSSYDKYRRKAEGYVDAVGAFTPGLGGALDLGIESLYLMNDLQRMALQGDKLKKSEIQKQIRRVAGKGLYSPITYMADLFDLAGWVQKHYKLDAKTRRIK